MPIIRPSPHFRQINQLGHLPVHIAETKRKAGYQLKNTDLLPLHSARDFSDISRTNLDRCHGFWVRRNRRNQRIVCPDTGNVLAAQQ